MILTKFVEYSITLYIIGIAKEFFDVLVYIPYLFILKKRRLEIYCVLSPS